MTITTPDETEIRRVLTEESTARLALRHERARLFLNAVAAGNKTSEAWQQVALATADLERAYEVAHNEKLILWYLAGRMPPEGDEAAE